MTPSLVAPEPGVESQRFRCILADPPWEFSLWGRDVGGRSPASHYETQAKDWLQRLPVQAVCDRNCALLLWSTNPHLPEALELVKAWGFTYSTKLTWVKMSRAAAPRIGLGYRARACTEDLLLCFRGDVRAPAPADRPQGVIFSPPGAHSRKPDWQYDLAELYPGPFLEMFHRPRGSGLFGEERPGWTFTGNECPGNLDMREALERLAGTWEERVAA